MGWYSLAVVHSGRNECRECVAALERAMAVDSADGQIRDQAKRDPGLDNCRKDPQFQRLIAQPLIQSTPQGGRLPFVIGH